MMGGLCRDIALEFARNIVVVTAVTGNHQANPPHSVVLDM
jgi:hypothetical protein